MKSPNSLFINMATLLIGKIEIGTCFQILVKVVLEQVDIVEKVVVTLAGHLVDEINTTLDDIDLLIHLKDILVRPEGESVKRDSTKGKHVCSY